MASAARQEELRLVEETLALMSAEQARDVLERALDALLRLSGAQRGFLVRGRDGALEVVAARTREGECVAHVALPMHEFSHTLVERALRTGQILRHDDARAQASLRDAESVERLRIVSVLVAPLSTEGVSAGAVYLENRKASGVFDEGTVRLADQSARLASSVLGRTERLRALEEARAAEGGAPAAFRGLVGKSAALRAARDAVAVAARSDLPILLEGETGTGKGLFARAAHRASMRAGRPFVEINCASLPESLLEDELFGHVKGAFSGAQADRDGLFAAAHGGTIFLDEIGEMSPAMQAKLLRVVEDGLLRKVGSDRPERVDVRIISATSKSLEREVAAKHFRDDLYYRLNGVRVVVPPLRARKEDLPLLARHFLESASRRAGLPVPVVGEEAMQRLAAYDFPGNVRELETIVRRALLFARDGRIGPEALPPEVRGDVPPAEGEEAAPRTAEDLKRAVARARSEAAGRIECDFLRRALAEADGNVSGAARRTGMNRSRLQQMLARHGLRGRKIPPEA